MTVDGKHDVFQTVEIPGRKPPPQRFQPLFRNQTQGCTLQSYKKILVLKYGIGECDDCSCLGIGSFPHSLCLAPANGTPPSKVMKPTGVFISIGRGEEEADCTILAADMEVSQNGGTPKMDGS